MIEGIYSRFLRLGKSFFQADSYINDDSEALQEANIQANEQLMSMLFTWHYERSVRHGIYQQAAVTVGLSPEEDADDTRQTYAMLLLEDIAVFAFTHPVGEMVRVSALRKFAEARLESLTSFDDPEHAEAVDEVATMLLSLEERMPESVR